MGTKHDEINARLADKIELKPVTWLKRYDRNARTHPADQLDQIAASVAEFGFTNPILAKADGTIIAGHGRLEAVTTRLGLTEVPVIVLDYLTDAQARALVLADNKIAENAGWDEELLAEELLALEADGISLELTGFSADELDELIGEEEPPAKEKEQAEPASSKFQEMNFTVEKTKVRRIRAALKAAIGTDEGMDTGDALAILADFFLRRIKENKDKPKKPKGAAAKK